MTKDELKLLLAVTHALAVLLEENGSGVTARELMTLIEAVKTFEERYPEASKVKVMIGGA